MFMPLNILFILVLVFSTLVSITASTWLGAWLGLEINLMSVIPLMVSRSLYSVESAMKYFLVQAFSSLLLMLGLVVWMFKDVYLINGVTSGLAVVQASLLVKLGAAPFYHWFPSVVSGLGWGAGFTVMTWQKLAPMVLVSYILLDSVVMVIVVIMSVVIGSVGGLNQSSLRKLMAYSSINHLGWMLFAVMFGLQVALIYYLIYTVTSAVLIGGLWEWGYFYLSQLFYGGGHSSLKLLLGLNWLSFGGLPPFIGFFPKWVVVELGVGSGMHIAVLLMVVFSLLALFYYTRVCYLLFSMSGVMILPFRDFTGLAWLNSVSAVWILSGLLTVPLLAMCQ